VETLVFRSRLQITSPGLRLDQDVPRADEIQASLSICWSHNGGSDPHRFIHPSTWKKWRISKYFFSPRARLLDTGVARSSNQLQTSLQSSMPRNRPRRARSDRSS